MNDEQEVWRDVVGYNGLYMISSFGNIVNCNRPMKFHSDRDGYLIVSLTKNKQKKKKKPDLKAKLESPGAYTLTAAERGCADASLYQRFREAGLVDVRMFPQLAPFDSATPSRLRSRNAQILANLSDEEGREWQEAATQAQSGGTFIIGEPHHCAVGTRL